MHFWPLLGIEDNAKFSIVFVLKFLSCFCPQDNIFIYNIAEVISKHVKIVFDFYFSDDYAIFKLIKISDEQITSKCENLAVAILPLTLHVLCL